MFGSPDKTRETNCLHNISNENISLAVELRANGGPMKVIGFVFVNNGDKYSTSYFCKLISKVHHETEMCRACRIYYTA